MRVKAGEIIANVKRHGRAALNQVSEFFGVSTKLKAVRENVRETISDTTKNIEKIRSFGAELHEANHKIAGAFRTFADKPAKEEAQKKQKISKTELLLKPWKAHKKLLMAIELHLDAAIDKTENLSRQVELDRMKEKMKEVEQRIEQTSKKNSSADGVERVEGEVVTDYAPALVAEPAHIYGSEVFDEYLKNHGMEDTPAVSVKTEMQEKKAR